MAKVWIDEQRCAGCGVCVSACPTQAITVVGRKARVNPDLCRGCEVCVRACPMGAIAPVMEGKIVEAPAEEVAAPEPVPQQEPILIKKPEVAQRDVAPAPVEASGVALGLQVLQGLVDVVGHWLTRPPASSNVAQRAVRPTGYVAPMRPFGGGGRRIRYRRRGRRRW